MKVKKFGPLDFSHLSFTACQGTHPMALMFNKTDVEMAGHHLVRLLRMIFYRRKISLDDFASLWAEHGRRLGLPPDKNNTNKNNARKQLDRSKEEITWRFFNYILTNIIGLNIEEVRIVVRMDDGSLVEFGSNDPVDSHRKESHMTTQT